MDRARNEEFSLPRYVENELRDYVKCGILAHGFVRIRCKDCGKSKNRLLWAALLARTFRLDMETCSHCGGKMRMVAAVTDFVSIKRYLDGVGLLSEIPEVKPARPPPQLDIKYDDLEYADG